MALLDSAVAGAQAAIEKDIPQLEDAEKQVILAGIAALDSMLRAIIEGYTVTITIKAVKNP